MSEDLYHMNKVCQPLKEVMDQELGREVGLGFYSSFYSVLENVSFSWMLDV